MPNKLALKRKKYIRRKKRVRGKILGTPECPRLSVQKSLKHVYAQIIDDLNGSTLAFASTLTKDVAGRYEGGEKKGQKGFKVGEFIAEMAKSKGIEKVVFDRQGNRYHGRIKALADGARKGGLKF